MQRPVTRYGCYKENTLTELTRYACYKENTLTELDTRFGNTLERVLITMGESSVKTKHIRNRRKTEKAQVGEVMKTPTKKQAGDRQRNDRGGGGGWGGRSQPNKGKAGWGMGKGGQRRRG